MLPEVQIVSISWPLGACRRHEISASASATSETLTVCRIGKQYAVREDLTTDSPVSFRIAQSRSEPESCFQDVVRSQPNVLQCNPRN